MRHALTLDLVPPDCAFHFFREEDADPVGASPEGGVDDENGFLWSNVRHADFDGIKMFAHPHVRTLRRTGKLLQGLLAADVRFP